MTIDVTVGTFTYTDADGATCTFERICVNNMPLKPMYEKDKRTYRFLIDLIKNGKEDK